MSVKDSPAVPPLLPAAPDGEGWRPFTEFLLLTFGVTWGLGIVAIAWPSFAAVTFDYLLYVAVAAPSLAALVVIARWRGRDGLRAWWRSLSRWRVDWRYWLVPLAGLPAVGVAARALEAATGGRPFELGWTVPLSVAAAIPVAIVLDPGWTEEPGWRGFALPRLVQRIRWRSAALVLGAITTLWHVPAWFVAGMTQGSYEFGAFVLFHLSNAVLMAAMVVRTGSVLVGGVAMHLMANLVVSPTVGADLAWAGVLLGTAALTVMAVGVRQAATGAAAVGDS